MTSFIVPVHFHDVTNDKSRSVKSNLTKNAECVQSRRNSYLSHRTYPDTSVELVQTEVGLTSLNTFKKHYKNS